MGTFIDPMPVTGLAANFSPIPRIAPPPFGRLSAGAAAIPGLKKIEREDLDQEKRGGYNQGKEVG